MSLHRIISSCLSMIRDQKGDVQNMALLGLGCPRTTSSISTTPSISTTSSILWAWLGFRGDDSSGGHVFDCVGVDGEVKGILAAL
jgi:hypothetical protein